MMGKFANLEIIPLDDNDLPPVNNQQNSFRNNYPVYPPFIGFIGQPAGMPRTNFISDPTIIPRVQKYVECNVGKAYIDVDIMADDLQKLYKDYSRRKRVPFRNSVKKAYAMVMRSYGRDNNLSSSEDLSDESVGDEESHFADSMSTQLMEMYNRPHKPIDENELIDISSDDSNDQTPINEKPANGESASTSQKPKHSVVVAPLLLKKALKPPVEEAIPATVPQNDRGKKRKGDHQYSAVAPNSPKRKKSVATLQEPTVTFKDIGGLDAILVKVCKLLVHIRHPEVYRQIGMSPPRGFLLHGPPGCGKTLLAHAIAGELSIPLLKVAGPELVSGVSGESEERIRDLFERAVSSVPCILFIDEVDAITPNRENAQKGMERRIVAQLLSCLDELNSNKDGDQIVVIGATNRPDAIDPALRRSGRFDKEICLGIPDQKARVNILKVLSSPLKFSEGFDFDTIAKYSPGFVGADLLALIREASMVAANRLFNNLKEKRDLETAIAIQKATQELLQKQQQKQQQQQQHLPPSASPESSIKPPTELADSVETATATSTEASEIDVVEQTNSGSGDGLIVVIDDDIKAEKLDTEVNITPSLNKEDAEKLQTALQLFQPPLTELETMLSWLHDEAPISIHQLLSMSITMDDFALALKSVQPSAKREGFANVPNVTWDDIGSLRGIREELQMAILAPVQHAEHCKTLGLTTSTGVLLCGPPGCGKTLLAKAIANEAGINFISVKGPELLNMYVGESEKAVRTCFERARNSAPCVIFFDEFDSLCPKRSDTGEGGVAMRVVNQMLTEMDGIQDRSGVYLLAATNRPDIVDPAVLRPGRLDKILYVGLPTAEDRADILRAVTRNGTHPPLAPDVNLELIGKSDQCEGYTGADLAALVREASKVALQDFLQQSKQLPLVVTTEHFKRAVGRIRPSITEKDQKHYEKLKRIYSVPSAAVGDVEEMEYS